MDSESAEAQEAQQDLGGLSFEEALSRLDETVQALEKGGLAIADSTRLFEEGAKLARRCHDLLAGAELKISRIETAYGALASDSDDEPGELP